MLQSKRSEGCGTCLPAPATDLLVGLHQSQQPPAKPGGVPRGHGTSCRKGQGQQLLLAQVLAPAPGCSKSVQYCHFKGAGMSQLPHVRRGSAASIRQAVDCAHAAVFWCCCNRHTPHDCNATLIHLAVHACMHEVSRHLYTSSTHLQTSLMLHLM
jgi:hypothetical protein